MATQWHFHPDTYLAMVREEIPSYDALQDALADATTSVRAERILDLGSGTGVTARAVLDRRAAAELVGIDASDGMLDHARRLVPGARFLAQDLNDGLPPGPFDLVTSAFAIHHLDADEKSDLFGRIADVLAPGGRLALLDVVVPTAPVVRPIPLDPEIDQPSTVADQLIWLGDAGLDPIVVKADDDLALIVADRRAPGVPTASVGRRVTTDAVRSLEDDG